MNTVVPIGGMTVEDAATKVVEAFREHLSPRQSASLLAAPAHKISSALAEVVIIAQGDAELYRLLDFVPLAKFATKLQKLGDQLIEMDGLEQNIMGLLTGDTGCAAHRLLFQ